MANKQETEKIESPRYFSRLVVAFLLASLVFFGAFVMGYNVSYSKYMNLAQSQENLRYSMLSFEIEKQIIDDNCSNFNPLLFYDEVNQLGDIIGILEDRLGKDNADVLEQKKIYSLLETRHLLYVMEHNNRCSNKYPIILFFYSNTKEFSEGGQSLGYILTSAKNNRNDMLLIYSYDYDLDSNVIALLREKYNVTSPNSLVINGKTYSKNINDLVTIEEYLKKPIQ
jgi:hypothetical protein